MFDKYDFMIKVCELADEIPESNRYMSSNKFNYNRGYIKALLDVLNILDELDN